MIIPIENVELKPCPFCGRNPKFEEELIGYQSYVKIRCPYCDVALTKYLCHYSPEFGHIDDPDYYNSAIERWNTRYNENGGDVN